MATGGRSCSTIGGRRFALPDLAGSTPIEVVSQDLTCTIVDDEVGNTAIDVSWAEPTGARSELSARIEMPAGHETLNVVIPWSSSVYQFTSKHQARPARGTRRVGGDAWEFGRDDDAWGATENGVLVDGRLSKIGRELEWTYDWHDPMSPWRVRDPGGQIDVTLSPRYDEYGPDRLPDRPSVGPRWIAWISMSTPRSSRRLLLEFIAVFALVALVGTVAAVMTVRSDTSHASDESSSGGSKTPTTGTIVSSTPIANAPAGSTGWRIVYTTTTATGQPAQSSGTVYVPTAPAPDGGRFVVAWAHPTLGMGQDCTPSQATDPSAAIPGFAQMIANGWVVASTDYTGLGTTGVLPYLISLGESYNVMDSVRAARNLPGTNAGTTYAVWGHSQGGHASLSTTNSAAAYAPELRLAGVAAAAPAAELPALVQLQWQSPESWVIGSEVILLWPQFYSQLQASQIATPLAIQQAPAVGAACITANPAPFLQQFGSVLVQPFFSVDPVTVPAWLTQLVVNTPQAPTAIPVYVAQGLQDTTVLPSTTALLDVQWCQKGTALTVQWLPTATHMTVPAMAATNVMTWLQQVFAGQSPGNTCGQTLPIAAATNPPGS